MFPLIRYAIKLSSERLSKDDNDCLQCVDNHNDTLMHVEVGMSIGYFRVQNSPFKTMLSAMSFICLRIVTAFSNSFINVSVYLVFTTNWGHNNKKRNSFPF